MTLSDDELRALAMDATGPAAAEYLANPDNRRQLDIDGNFVGVPRQALDELLASYSTANPATILSLLDRVNALEAAHAAARENFHTMQNAANELRLRAKGA